MPKMSVRYKLFDSYDSYLYLYLYWELVNALKRRFIAVSTENTRTNLNPIASRNIENKEHTHEPEPQQGNP
jgi:hypothetical protein